MSLYEIPHDAYVTISAILRENPSTCAYSDRKTGFHPRIKSEDMLLRNTRWDETRRL
jgi:hypothetical protein